MCACVCTQGRGLITGQHDSYFVVGWAPPVACPSAPSTFYIHVTYFMPCGLGIHCIEPNRLRHVGPFSQRFDITDPFFKANLVILSLPPPSQAGCARPRIVKFCWNGSGFNTSIMWHGGILGTADEVVLIIEHIKKGKTLKRTVMKHVLDSVSQPLPVVVAVQLLTL